MQFACEPIQRSLTTLMDFIPSGKSIKVGAILEKWQVFKFLRTQWNFSQKRGTCYRIPIHVSVIWFVKVFSSPVRQLVVQSERKRNNEFQGSTAYFESGIGGATSEMYNFTFGQNW